MQPSTLALVSQMANIEHALKGLGNIDCRVIGDKLIGLETQFFELCLFVSVTLDVYEQKFIDMKLQEYANYFQTSTIPAEYPQNTTLNLLCLAVPLDSNYSKKFRLPHLVQDVDLTMLYRDLE
jgi:hypothetical protein